MQFALNLCQEVIEDVNVNQDIQANAKMIFAHWQDDDSEYKSQLKNICIQKDLKVGTRLEAIKRLCDYFNKPRQFLQKNLKDILKEAISDKDRYYAKLLFSKTFKYDDPKQKILLQELYQDSATDIDLWVEVAYGLLSYCVDSTFTLNVFESIISHPNTSIEDKMWAKNAIANIFLSDPPDTFTKEEAIQKARLLLEECLNENSISEKLKDCTQFELLGTYMNDDLDSCQKAYELSQIFIKENVTPQVPHKN